MELEIFLENIAFECGSNVAKEEGSEKLSLPTRREQVMKLAYSTSY